MCLFRCHRISVKNLVLLVTICATIAFALWLVHNAERGDNGSIVMVGSLLPNASSSTSTTPNPTTATVSVVSQPTATAPAPTPMVLKLKGEPKSGTTWLEIVFFQIASELCTLSNGCRFIGTFDQTKKRGFTLDFRGAKRRFTAVLKHMIKNDFRGGVDCKHDDNLEDHPPCFLRNFHFPKLPQLSSIEGCVDVCCSVKHGAPPEFHMDTTYVHVHRDPRDVAVSECFHIGKGGNVNKLTKCVKKVYPNVLLWAKYRQEWFRDGRGCAKANVLHLSYEDLVRCPAREYSKLVESLLPGIEITGPQIKMLYEMTSPNGLKNSTKYDVRNPSRHHPKVRDAGKHNYTSYNFPSDLLFWMDKSYEAMSFDYFRPHVPLYPPAGLKCVVD